MTITVRMVINNTDDLPTFFLAISISQDMLFAGVVGKESLGST